MTTAVPFSGFFKEVPLRRWTREEYYRLEELGLFRPSERLELIRGEIVDKRSPQGNRRAFGIRVLQHALKEANDMVENFAYDIRAQLPITLTNDTEPEPDVCVARGTFHDYESQHPESNDMVLVAEVSDTTLAYDRTLKAQIYAEAGITEYWLLNLHGRQLEIRRGPVNGVYQSVMILGELDTVTLLFAPRATITIAALLPRATGDE